MLFYHCTLKTTCKSLIRWKPYFFLSHQVPILKQTKCSWSVWICVRRCSTEGKAELIRSCWLLIRCGVSKDGTAIHCRRHTCSKEPCAMSAFSRYWWSKEVCCFSRQMKFTTCHSEKGSKRQVSTTPKVIAKFDSQEGYLVTCSWLRPPDLLKNSNKRFRMCCSRKYPYSCLWMVFGLDPLPLMFTGLIPCMMIWADTHHKINWFFLKDISLFYQLKIWEKIKYIYACICHKSFYRVVLHDRKTAITGPGLKTLPEKLGRGVQQVS